jgi:hypothetical protein
MYDVTASTPGDLLPAHMTACDEGLDSSLHGAVALAALRSQRSHRRPAEAFIVGTVSKREKDDLLAVW